MVMESTKEEYGILFLKDPKTGDNSNTGSGLTSRLWAISIPRL